MAAPVVQPSFAAGELSPSMFGRVDFSRYHIGLSTGRNGFISYRGGFYSRMGSKFVGFSKQTGRSLPPRCVTFQFSINQGLCLEFGNLYMRVISEGGYVLEDPVVVTGATRSNPCTVTAPGNVYANGDWLTFAEVGGMTELNGNTYVVTNKAGDDFDLLDAFGQPVDSSAFNAYTSGGVVARIYTLVTPWADADVEWLKFTQSADVMSVCCWNQETNTSYAPYDLARLADNNWTLTALDTGASIDAPASIVGVATDTTVTSPTDYNYVVTAVDASTAQESVASPIADIPDSVNIAATAGSINLQWTPVDGAAYYNVYKAPPAYNSQVPVGSLFGYAGKSYGVKFVDTNITADLGSVPPLHQNPFSPGRVLSVDVLTGGSAITTCTIAITSGTGAGFSGYAVIDDSGVLASVVVSNPGHDYRDTDTVVFTCNGGATDPTATLTVGALTGTYPSVPSYYQQRRIYAGTPNQPDTYWMSQPGAFTNFDTRVPTIDSDAITGTPWSLQVNGIQYMVSMPGGLVVLTGLAAWQVTGVGSSGVSSQAITPANQQATPQAYNGCHDHVPPVKINYDILYVQAKGSTLRDLAYNFFVNIYTGTDLTYLSTHLFVGYQIREMAWCEEPYKLLWAVRDDGVLLSLTFVKEQEVAGWARHDTNGLFKSVAAVTETDVDACYVATQRFTPEAIATAKNCYMIERLDNRIWLDIEDVWAVDCGLQLAQQTPDAELWANSATGLGSIASVTVAAGGANYGASTTISIDDPTGTGAVLTPTIVAGVVTAVVVTSAGTGYSYPRLVFNDPTNAGRGADASANLNTTMTFTATANAFLVGDIGKVIRMGGGIATITGYTAPTVVTASMTQPIARVIPASGLPVPAPSGEWTMTRPVTEISGLQHLAGMTVTGLADGEVVTPRTVEPDGSVTLDTAASAVVLGLGFQAQAQTLYMDAGQPTLQGRKKKIGAVTARLEASKGVQAGTNQPDGSVLSPARLAPIWVGLSDVSDLGVPVYGSDLKPLYTGDTRVPVSGGFSNKPGQVCFQQDYPLPMQILATIAEVMPGDDTELSAKK